MGNSWRDFIGAREIPALRSTATKLLVNTKNEKMREAGDNIRKRANIEKRYKAALADLGKNARYPKNAKNAEWQRALRHVGKYANVNDKAAVLAKVNALTNAELRDIDSTVTPGELKATIKANAQRNNRAAWERYLGRAHSSKNTLHGLRRQIERKLDGNKGIVRRAWNYVRRVPRKKHANTNALLRDVLSDNRLRMLPDMGLYTVKRKQWELSELRELIKSKKWSPSWFARVSRVIVTLLRSLGSRIPLAKINTVVSILWAIVKLSRKNSASHTAAAKLMTILTRVLSAITFGKVLDAGIFAIGKWSLLTREPKFRTYDVNGQLNMAEDTERIVRQLLNFAYATDTIEINPVFEGGWRRAFSYDPKTDNLAAVEARHEKAVAKVQELRPQLRNAYVKHFNACLRDARAYFATKDGKGWSVRKVLNRLHDVMNSTRISITKFGNYNFLYYEMYLLGLFMHKLIGVDYRDVLDMYEVSPEKTSMTLLAFSNDRLNSDELTAVFDPRAAIGQLLQWYMPFTYDRESKIDLVLGAYDRIIGEASHHMEMHGLVQKRGLHAQYKGIAAGILSVTSMERLLSSKDKLRNTDGTLTFSRYLTWRERLPKLFPEKIRPVPAGKLSSSRELVAYNTPPELKQVNTLLSKKVRELDGYIVKHLDDIFGRIPNNKIPTTAREVIGPMYRSFRRSRAAVPGSNNVQRWFDTYKLYFENKNTKSDYETLGIPATATNEELKKAYFAKARVTHTNKGGSNKKFIEIKNAYNRIVAQRNKNRGNKNVQ